MMNINWFWIKGPNNEASVTLSFMVASFLIVVFKLVFGGSEINLEHFKWVIQPIDASTLTGFLAVTFGSYVGRKYTDAKFIDANNNGVDDRDEVLVKKEG